MPRPWLSEIAYSAYCSGLHLPPQWEALPWREKLAWGLSVQAACAAAHDLTLVLAPVLAAGAAEKPAQQAYILYAVEHRPQAEVCARLGISRRTLYRYISQQRQAVYAA